MNTKIANRIYIQDPTDEVKQWAKDNLCFPNPEYEKKLQMGFWVGKTPRELRLYEWNGNTMILPFGVVREIMPMLRGTTVICDFRQDNVIDYGRSDMGLYDYQREAVRQMIDAKYGILKAGCGAGKTNCGIALVKAFRRRALWLCNKHDLIRQSMERAEQFMDPELFGTITEGRINVGIGITFATVQTMCKLDLTQYRDYWDVVIVDECFPCNTMIQTKNGIKQIKDISTGDEVLTLNDNNQIETKKVLTVFKKVPHSIVKLVLTNGAELYCTGNHPILTEGGYKKADEITNLDAVCCLRKRNGYFRPSAGNKVLFAAQKWKSLLLGNMQEEREKCLDRRTKRKGQAEHDQSEQDECFQKNEGKQSCKEQGNTGTYFIGASGNGMQTEGPRRKRNRFDRAATDYRGSAESVYSGDRVRSSDQDSKGKRISDLLQTGHRHSGDKTRNRGGWIFSLLIKKTRAGQKERGSVEFIRVDRVEIQEQTSNGTYGGLCEDGYVYNLEVEGNHNYFANGINVHNCHNVCASATTFTMYEKVLNHLSARHKIGLTATDHRADGLIKATFALIGKVAYEIPKEATADRVTEVKIRTVKTDTEITDDCLGTDGMINYIKLIQHIATDEERNKLIASTIILNKEHSCLILSDRLSQLETIRNLLPYEMQEESVYINGRMTSKAAKEERQQAMEMMRTGEKKYFFGSYKIAREGLDIPCLDRLFMASPVKDPAVVEQSVGRIRRVSDGKTEVPVVYDFLDHEIGMCCGWHKKRCRIYRQMGAEIE